MSELKISAMERRTLSAIDSSNPFSTPTRPPQTIDGRLLKSPEPQEISVPEPEITEPEPEVIAPVVEKGKKKKAKDALEETPVPTSEEFVNPIVETHNADGMPSYRAEFAGRDIFVGLPWYKNSNPVTVMTLLALALDFGKDKIRFDLVMGDPLIYRARNRIVQKFLETDAKWLFMLDDDMIPAIGRAAWYKHWVNNVQNASNQALSRGVLHRLIGAGKTLVGGAYFGRQEDSKLMCSHQSLANDAKVYADKVLAVEWVGAGCLLVHRKVFEDIREKNPELVSNDPLAPVDYFLPTSGAGDDVSFCKRAKDAGHQPFIDLGIPVKHVGHKPY